MPELTAADVSAFTNDRLPDDGGEGETTRMLNAALVAARNYCGWHVSPVIEDAELVLDGPGGGILDLPTRNLLDISELTENDTAVEVKWSKTGAVRKASRSCWTCEYQAIAVTITHGFTEDEAADWRQAILAMVVSISRTASDDAEPAGPLVTKKIDDVEYQWADYSNAAQHAVYEVAAVLDRYRRDFVVFA